VPFDGWWTPSDSLDPGFAVFCFLFDELDLTLAWALDLDLELCFDAVAACRAPMTWSRPAGGTHGLSAAALVDTFDMLDRVVGREGDRVSKEMNSSSLRAC
jgi:hypothetical protein